MDIEGGWSEAVFSVARLEPWLALAESCGWRQSHHGETSAAELAAWGLLGADAEEVEFALEPESARRFRFVRFGDGRGPTIRPGANAWDIGGWSGFTLQCDDAVTVFERIAALGWVPMQDLARNENTADGVEAKVVLRGYDGVRLSLLQLRPEYRVRPRRAVPVNLVQVHADMGVARRFYGEVLGLGAVFDQKRPMAPAAAALGLPAGLIERQTVQVVVYGATGIDGTVEVVQFGSLGADDFASRSAPPNRGLFLATYRTFGELDELAERFEARGGVVVYRPVQLTAGDREHYRAFALKAPNGAWVGFREADRPSMEGRA